MNEVNTETGEVTPRSIKNVATKIALAMQEMDSHVPKDGENKFHKYQYTSISQYIAHVRPAMIKQGLVIIPKLIELVDYDDATTDAVMEYTIIDSESGEYISTRLTGRGQDSSSTGKRLDKGPYKAYSGAFKYFLAEMFMIASGDDPDESGPGNTKKAQAKQDSPQNGKMKPPAHWSQDEAKRDWVEKALTKKGIAIEYLFKGCGVKDWPDMARFEDEGKAAFDLAVALWQKDQAQPEAA